MTPEEKALLLGLAEMLRKHLDLHNENWAKGDLAALDQLVAAAED